MPSTSTIPLQIAGYIVLPISFPPIPSFPQAATHYLYLAPHQPRDPTPTDSRSLFLVNIPSDSTEAHIKNLLSTQLGLPAGRIEDVQFEGQRRRRTDKADETSVPAGSLKKGKKRKRGNKDLSLEETEGLGMPSVWDRELQIKGLTAVVVFVDRTSMGAASKAAKTVRKEKKVPVWGEGLDGKVPNLGSSRYLNHHRLTYPDKAQLLDSVNNFMTAFAAREAAQARLQTRQRQEVDADGFVTVTRGGRTNPAKQEAAQEQAEKQKEKHKGLDDFYRFQSREKRKERAGELVRKFEEDKERIRKMREKKGKFRPE